MNYAFMFLVHPLVYNILMRNKLKIALTCIFIITLFSLFFITPDVNGTEPGVEKIQKAYEGLKDLKGSFVQTSHIKDLKRTDTYKGSFMIKMPALMKWLYRAADNKETEVFLNNDEMIIYQRQEKQAFRGKFDRETYGQAPIAIMGGFGNIEKEFDISSRGEKLLLKPKKPMGAFVSIELTLSGNGFPIAVLSIIDKRANRIDIAFKDVAVNTGVKDSVFNFSLPKGVSLYDNSRPQ